MITTIDPYLLSVPSLNNLTQEEANNFLINLQKWNEEFLLSRDYIVSAKVLGELVDLSLYPDPRGNLYEFLKKYDKECRYSAMDLAKGWTSIITNIPFLEERIHAEKTEYEIEILMETLSVVPVFVYNRLPKNVAKAFTSSLLFCSYTLLCLKDTRQKRIATIKWQNPEDLSTLEIDTEIEEIKDAALSKSKINTTWDMYSEPEEIYAQKRIVDVFQADPHLATKIAWCKLKLNGTPLKGISKDIFVFGTRFLESLCTPSMKKRQHYEVEIEDAFIAIVCVLEDVWKYGSDKHHALRKDVQSRQSDQIKRTRSLRHGQVQEKASRVEVSAREGTLRLHYWKCHDGCYEFANVTDVHDDPTIYSDL